MSALKFRAIVVAAAVSVFVPIPGFTEQVATTFQQLQKQIQNGQPV